MDNIQRWLKSLRLHKYQPLFKALTYEEMLNLDEAFLVDKQVTKGARNKILVSVRKLNMRQDRLLHLFDDINQGNLSLKEALTALSDMLITPIPQPSSVSSSPTPSLSSASSSASAASSTSGSPTLAPATPASTPSPASSTCSSTSGFCSDSDAASVSSMGSLTSTASNDPHHLTYLFVDTFEKVAQHLIESPDYEDAACHGIMATIVDECLKHNSFTKEQKARVARFRQPHMSRQYHRHPLQRRQQLPQPLARQSHWHPFQRRQQQQSPQTQQQLLLQLQQQHHNQQQQHHQQQQQAVQPPGLQYYWHSVKQQRQPHQYPHQQSYDTGSNNRSNSNNANGNSIGSIVASSAASRHSNYKEYSLLSPCLTFELPCLRARMSGTTS